MLACNSQLETWNYNPWIQIIMTSSNRNTKNRSHSQSNRIIRDNDLSNSNSHGGHHRLWERRRTWQNSINTDDLSNDCAKLSFPLDDPEKTGTLIWWNWMIIGRECEISDTHRRATFCHWNLSTEIKWNGVDALQKTYHLHRTASSREECGNNYRKH